MARSASKSPARKTRGNVAAGVVSPVAKEPASPAPAAKSAPAGPEIDTGIVVLVLVLVWYLCNGMGGSPNLKSFVAALQEGMTITIPDVPVIGPLIHGVMGKTWNFVLGMHVINTITSNRGGNGGWLANFGAAFFATFAGVAVPAILAGGNIITSLFADQGAHWTVGHFFAVWYVLNYDIPGCPVNFGLWKKVADLGGAPLQILLGFGTATFNANLVIASANASGTQYPFSQGWFVAVVTAVVIGSASDFFPFNKGFNLPSGNDCFAKAFFICGNGFAFIDTVIAAVVSLVNALFMEHFVLVLPAALGNCGQTINDNLMPHFGGVAGFVAFVTAMNFLFGSFIPAKTGKGFDMFGVVDMIMEAIQLN